MVTCSRCGHGSHPGGARFCSLCGTPLAPGAAPKVAGGCCSIFCGGSAVPSPAAASAQRGPATGGAAAESSPVSESKSAGLTITEAPTALEGAAKKKKKSPKVKKTEAAPVTHGSSSSSSETQRLMSATGAALPVLPSRVPEEEEKEEHDEVSSSSSLSSLSSSGSRTPRAKVSKTCGAGEEKESKSVVFVAPVVSDVAYVPLLDEWAEAEKRAAYWSHREYAQIRSRQRELILQVLKQTHDYPPGVIPPPIPGESRRGLGLCCEPGTVGGRAARVAFGRTQVVEAYRRGTDPADLAKLCVDLSGWAAKNARDVGLKDETTAAVEKDFNRTFFLNGSAGDDAKSLRSARASGARPSPKSVARAMPTMSRAESSSNSVKSYDGAKPSTPLPGQRESIRSRSFSVNDVGQGTRESLHVAHAQRKSAKPPRTVGKDEAAVEEELISPTTTTTTTDDDDASVGVDDGYGLASMVRSDSLTNLNAAATAHLTQHEAYATKSPAHDAGDDGTIFLGDGYGLASMVKNDSLNNLAQLAQGEY